MLSGTNGIFWEGVLSKVSNQQTLIFTMYKIRVFLAQKNNPWSSIGPKVSTQYRVSRFEMTWFSGSTSIKSGRLPSQEDSKPPQGVPRQQNCNLCLLSKVFYKDDHRQFLRKSLAKIARLRLQIVLDELIWNFASFSLFFWIQKHAF